jgi:hypothetical protein
MRNVFAYEIYDRRTGDQIDERDLDSAIKAHIEGEIALETYDDYQKIEMLEDVGFKVRPLDFITTLRHSGPLRAPQTAKPTEEHVQIDFNYLDRTVNFDLHMEEHDGKPYLMLEFFPIDGILTRMFDIEGNEKVFEACPHCGEEVILDAREKVKQPCPKCGELIKACCLCAGDKDCANCG